MHPSRCSLHKQSHPIGAWIWGVAYCLASLAHIAAHAQTANIAANQTAKQTTSNAFNDPFVSITRGLPQCPVPLGPTVTPAEFAEEAHWRSQRGVSCHTAGRCRLPNAYLYDAEIIPRVRLAITANGRFKGTSVWAYGQRRWVYLQGCVASAEESAELERIVKLIDDVESVINELSVGTAGPVRYKVK